MDLSFYVRGLLLGFTIAAQVGPMFLLCVRRTLISGRMAGFVSGLGIAAADATYASIGGFGLTFLSGFLVSQQFWFRLIGGLFICYLGIKTVITPPADHAANIGKTGHAGIFASTFLLTLSNPMTILAFAAILAGLGLGGTNGNYISALFLILGVFCGSLLWWFILSTGVNAFRQKFTPQLLNWINRLSGLLITLFGLLALASLLS
ncbi:MAG TPA: LysE family transporter [Chloroflexia bacterium]|nr:LysE family transporter [Chloroflexia bacterium]